MDGPGRSSSGYPLVFYCTPQNNKDGGTVPQHVPFGRGPPWECETVNRIYYFGPLEMRIQRRKCMDVTDRELEIRHRQQALRRTIALPSGQRIVASWWQIQEDPGG